MEKINRTVYVCDYCQEEFLTEEECKIHEEKCRKALITEKTKEVEKEVEDYSTKLAAKMENFVKENNLSPEEIMEFMVGVMSKFNNKRFSLPEVNTTIDPVFLTPKENPAEKLAKFENLIDSIIKER